MFTVVQQTPGTKEINPQNMTNLIKAGPAMRQHAMRVLNLGKLKLQHSTLENDDDDDDDHGFHADYQFDGGRSIAAPGGRVQC